MSRTAPDAARRGSDRSTSGDRTTMGDRTTVAAVPSGMARGTGEALRVRREELGQTLQQVARATRIPVEHLQAMEADRFDKLPAGPYAAAYLKAVEDHLGAAVPVEDHAPVALPQSAFPLAFVRMVALLSVAAMAAAIFVSYRTRFTPPAPAEPEIPAAPVPDQQVIVVARRTVDLKVKVDGQPVLGRNVAGGERLVFDAFDLVEVELPALDAVKFEFNGETIVPQGRQDVPRRLVFADSTAGGAR